MSVDCHCAKERSKRSRSQNLSPASDPAAQCRPAGTVRRIFTRKTGFVTLDRLLARLHANKPELLMVLIDPKSHSSQLGGRGRYRV